MNPSLITPTNILFIIGLIGIIFTVYNYFKNPQIKSDQDILRVTNDITEINKKFAEFYVAFQAHLTADQTSFSMLNQHVIEVDKSVVKLTTIIDERIPKKE